MGVRQVSYLAGVRYYPLPTAHISVAVVDDISPRRNAYCGRHLRIVYSSRFFLVTG